MASILPGSSGKSARPLTRATGTLPVIGQRPECHWTRRADERNASAPVSCTALTGKPESVFPDHARMDARNLARTDSSATNIMLFEQRLVTRLILPLEVIEQRTARGHQLQKTTTRMVVLHVGFEMSGEVGDAFRQDRNLNLGRAGVAGLVGIRLDDFRF